MNIRRLNATFLMLIAMFSAPVIATPKDPPQPGPDFYLIMSSCKTTIGYHALSDESLKIFDDESPINWGCARHSQKISCVLASPDGSPLVKGDLADFVLLLDSPPLLHFGTPNGADFIAVDTASHTAVIVSRVIQPKFVGSKVCWGLFTTESERQIMSGEQR